MAWCCQTWGATTICVVRLSDGTWSCGWSAGWTSIKSKAMCLANCGPDPGTRISLMWPMRGWKGMRKIYLTMKTNTLAALFIVKSTCSPFLTLSPPFEIKDVAMWNIISSEICCSWIGWPCLCSRTVDETVFDQRTGLIGSNFPCLFWTGGGSVAYPGYFLNHNHSSARQDIRVSQRFLLLSPSICACAGFSMM